MLVFWAPAPAPFRWRRAGLTALLFSLVSRVVAPLENSSGGARRVFSTVGRLDLIASRKDERLQATGEEGGRCALLRITMGEQRRAWTREGGWGGEEDLAPWRSRRCIGVCGDELGA